MKRKDLRNIVIFTNFDTEITNIVANKLKELGAKEEKMLTPSSIRGIFTDEFRNFYYFVRSDYFDLKSPRTMGGYKQLELEDLFSLKRENTIPPLTDENAPLKERLLNKCICLYKNCDLFQYVLQKLKYIFEKQEFNSISQFSYQFIYISLDGKVCYSDLDPNRLEYEKITIDQFKEFIADNLPDSMDDLNIKVTNDNKNPNPYKTCVSDCNCNYPYVKIWSGGDFSINNQIFKDLVRRNYVYTNHLFKKSIDENSILDEDLRDVK